MGSNPTPSATNPERGLLPSQSGRIFVSAFVAVVAQKTGLSQGSDGLARPAPHSRYTETGRWFAMLRLPALQGTIDRRILVNYRADADRVAALLPAPFHPKLVNGEAIVGICLIRLAGIRPRGIPPWVTIGSENAAHRIAVEWDDVDGIVREGVYVPRRDTSSCLVSLMGGRIFPGVLHRARFTVRESDTDLHVAMVSADGETRVSVDATLTGDLARTSIFRSLDEASAFFERGSVAYSPGATSGSYDGLELRSHGWKVEPLSIDSVTSSFFERADLFPRGSVTLDNALLMRRIEHEWHGHGVLTGSTVPSVRRSA